MKTYPALASAASALVDEEPKTAAARAKADQEMTPEQQVMFEEVYVPAFVEKCAQLGLPITDEAGLSEALETAALVKLALAKENQSTVKQANLSLKAALGLNEVEAGEARTAALQKTADALGKNPRVREAVVALLSKNSA